ncbi:MAG: two-component system, cell cycle response regulator [Gemmatimonadales bacterium]|nr:two-component system, cell cycle response regulator [Gemmatimonadales bacterium]
MNFVIDAELCVGCLACVRVCPTDAIAVAVDEPLLLRIDDEACIRCGQCLPACPHGAVKVNGEIGRALAIASEGDGVLILSPESVAHFYPATPEQVINACYAAGFRAVTRGVIGDELVAAEYLKLWEEEPWGTLIRSTDSVVVDTVRLQFPELLPYLAPVTVPPVAEARYLRAQYGPGLKIAYAGICPPIHSSELDAAITFGDLDQIFRIRGANVLTQPIFFERVPEERRRHLSAAGGLPLALLEQARYSSRRFRKLRGLDALKALARAVSVDRLDLGFVDILSTEGSLDHPMSGPRDELFWRRELLASTEPPRSRFPVVDTAVTASYGATFEIKQRPIRATPEAVAAILEQIGKGPNGRPWDCRACGFNTCQRFAESAALGRASLRQCTPYQERRAEEAQRAAAADALTGLSTYRVLRERLAFEIERSKRSNEGFALLFLDLDLFKQVNDQYGHEAGNEVLKSVAEEIRNAVRVSDIAARYGGDEFVVILTRTDLQGGARVAEALRAGIEGIGRRLGYPAGMVTVSIGLAEFDPHLPETADLLVAADRALYRAKAAGRNVVA